MTTYRFTATLTKRPYVRTIKGKVGACSAATDAMDVIRKIIAGEVEPETSVKITISPSRKKS